MKVYIEVVVLDNFLMDFLILSSTARLCVPLTRTLKRRCAYSAALGTCYATLAPLKAFLFLLHPACKIIASLAMVFTAFGWGNMRYFLKRLAVFWGLSLAMGGAIGGIWNLFGTVRAVSGMYVISGPALWAFVLIALAAERGFAALYRYFKARSAAAGGEIGVCFDMDDRQIELSGVVDTANYLSVPLEGSPVIVVPRDVLESKLGRSIKEEGISCYPVSFATASGEGSLQAFFPYGLQLKKDGRSCGARAAIGVIDKKLECEAIVPAALAGLIQGG